MKVKQSELVVGSILAGVLLTILAGPAILVLIGGGYVVHKVRKNYAERKRNEIIDVEEVD